MRRNPHRLCFGHIFCYFQYNEENPEAAGPVRGRGECSPQPGGPPESAQKRAQWWIPAFHTILMPVLKSHLWKIHQIVLKKSLKTYLASSDSHNIRDAAAGGASGHQEIIIANFRKNYARKDGIFHNKSPFFRTIFAFMRGQWESEEAR